jgi:hypothetical protein
LDGYEQDEVDVQVAGANDLEINQWPFLNGLLTEIVAQFNAPGGHLPTL